MVAGTPSGIIENCQRVGGHEIGHILGLAHFTPDNGSPERLMCLGTWGRKIEPTEQTKARRVAEAIIADFGAV